MRPDLYVSHVTSDIEPVSLVVDYFEAAVPGLDGHVACTSLPGYTQSGPQVFEGATVIGVVDGFLSEDVANELLLAADSAKHTVLLILRGGPAVQVPDALAHMHQLELHDGALAMLSEDLTHVVAARQRSSDAAQAAREELLSHAAHISSVPPVQAAPVAAVAEGPITDSERTAYRVFGRPAESVSDTPPSDTVAVGGGPQRTSSLVPKPRGPSALLSVSAGGALSDVVFGGSLGEAELIVLDGEFAEFLHGLGGDWFQLRSAPDAGTLAEAVDQLLGALPASRAELGHWYEAGYQLTHFCCLCASDASGEAGLRSQLAQARGRAWNAFWNAAAEVALPDHTTTALSALLEDVDAPSGARIEIAQCVEVLRNAAFDRDHARRSEAPPSDALESSAS